MGFYYSPKIVTDGLVLALDAANPKCISPLGNNSFNGAEELTKNLISPTDIIQSINGVNIGNLDFYTAFAIDYPEGSFGGDAANRQGITPGLNVRSGSKLYNASRALHMWVWNNDTNSWLPSSFFNGALLNGHCYDSWTGNSTRGGGSLVQVAQFVTDYNNIKSQFPNATYIAMGSHRDSRHTTDKINVLLDLGAPSNVSSLLGGAPEYILVGKPGLGAGNAFGWAYENHTVDPTRVAHLNFGLPIYGGPDNYFSFDGTDESINIAETSKLDLLSYTYAFWIRRRQPQSSSFLQFLQRSTSNRNPGIWFYINEINRIHFSIHLSNGTNTSVNPGGFFLNEWHYFTATVDYNGTNTVMRGYRDGVQVDSLTLSNVAPILGTGGTYIGRSLLDIGKLQIYNRALTAQEVLQNFNATKSRYGL
jgi:hypothetical protein